MSWSLSQSLGSSTNTANISVFFNLQNLHFMMEMGGCKCKIYDYKICFYTHSSKSFKTKLSKQFLIHFESWLYFHLIDQLFRVVFLIQLSCSVVCPSLDPLPGIHSLESIVSTLVKDSYGKTCLFVIIF